MSKRGFLLSGAWGLGNTGDQAILAVMVQKIHTFAPEEPLRVFSVGPGERIPGVEFVPARNFWAVVRAAAKSRVLLSGGGTLLQDTTSSRSLWYYLGILALARILGCRVMVFAAGLGPVRKKWNGILTRFVLNCAPCRITLRDSLSLAYLQGLGVKKDAKVTGDVAFLHPVCGENQRKNVVFCLRFWPEMEDRWPEISRGAALIRKELGLKPVLLPLGQGDAQVPVPGMKTLPPCEDWRDAARMLQEASLVLSMRLHGLILGGGTPAVGIGIDPKICGLCRDYDLQCLKPEELTGETILAAARSALQRDWTEGAATARKKAEENFAIAMELYNN